MLYTVIDLYDVFRNDLFLQSGNIKQKQFFSTVASDYLSKDGFYL